MTRSKARKVWTPPRVVPASVLAEKLRQRHWKKAVESWDEDEQDFIEHEICNQDGQKWPCFTEQMIRECEHG
jgi:hypothetical protein